MDPQRWFYVLQVCRDIWLISERRPGLTTWRHASNQSGGRKKLMLDRNIKRTWVEMVEHRCFQYAIQSDDSDRVTGARHIRGTLGNAACLCHEG